jgi:urocanate hydratase
MIQNNLDPEVAENPKELVVYGGIGAPRATGSASMRSSKRCASWATTNRC